MSLVARIVDRNNIAMMKETTAALVAGENKKVPDITVRWAETTLKECAGVYCKLNPTFDFAASVKVGRVMYMSWWQPDPKPLNEAGKIFLLWLAREMRSPSH